MLPTSDKESSPANSSFNAAQCPAAFRRVAAHGTCLRTGASRRTSGRMSGVTATSVSMIVAELRALLGAKLVAYLGGAPDPATVRRWAESTSDEEPDLESQHRLMSALRVARRLTEWDSPAVVQAWFQGQHPDLGDVAPARFVLEHPPEEFERRLGLE